jgi:fructokinase
VIVGGIEAGGTKLVCLVGTGDGEIVAETRLPTRRPRETIDDALAFFHGAADEGARVAAVGIAAFGPIDIRPGAGYGRILATPKPGWSGVDLVRPVRAALGVPVAVDTDVNAAAIAEARWGAGRGVSSLAYVTVGTGIGMGALVEGRPLHGLVHPEAGHVSVPREPGDDFPGACPFHGDCLEGMASGPAMAARWGRRPEALEGEVRDRAVDLEAAYLASGIRAIVYALAPERVILGGGVLDLPGLLPRIRERLAARLGGYPGLAEHADEGFVREAGLGQIAGARGALALAEAALAGTPPRR